MKRRAGDLRLKTAVRFYLQGWELRIEGIISNIHGESREVFGESDRGEDTLKDLHLNPDVDGYVWVINEEEPQLGLVVCYLVIKLREQAECLLIFIEFKEGKEVQVDHFVAHLAAVSIISQPESSLCLCDGT